MNTSAAHQYFSASFFNRVWEFIEKQNRTPEETEEMISLCHASLAHWRLREDCTRQNLSIGYWQLSRVYALAGQAKNSSHYAELCQQTSASEPPFYMAYAHEAAARAAALTNNPKLVQEHLTIARELAEKITDRDELQMLQADLDALSGSGI